MNICQFCGKEIKKGLELYGLLVCGQCHNRLTIPKNQTCITCKYFHLGECQYGNVAESSNWQTYNYNGQTINIPINGEDTPTQYNSCYHYRLNESIKIIPLDEELQTNLNSIDFNKEDYYPQQFISCDDCGTTTEIERDQPFICSKCQKEWEGD